MINAHNQLSCRDNVGSSCSPMPPYAVALHPVLPVRAAWQHKAPFTCGTSTLPNWTYRKNSSCSHHLPLLCLHVHEHGIAVLEIAFTNNAPTSGTSSDIACNSVRALYTWSAKRLQDCTVRKHTSDYLQNWLVSFDYGYVIALCDDVTEAI